MLNAPQFVWDWAETTSSTDSQSGCFGAHLSEIAVLRPAQMNRTKGENEPEFDSTGLNKV